MIFNHNSFGLPAAKRFYTEDDGGSGGGESTGGSDLSAFENPPDQVDMERGRNQERVEGEKPPDFSTLGGRKPAPKTEEGDEAPPEGEKPPDGQPAKPAGQKKEVQKPADTPKKEQEARKPEAKKQEAKPKVEDKPKVEAKKEEKPKEEKILTDAEIDALQPRADAPKQVVENFKQMRASMKTLAQQAREAQAAKEALAKEVETLKQSTGKLPEEVAKELEESRHFRLLFDAQNHPEFRKEYDSKIEAATESIYATLKKYGMKDAVIDKIKEVAAANGGDIEAWPRWNEVLKSFTDPLSKREAEDAILGRRAAIKAKMDKINALSSDRTAYVKEMEQKDKAEKDKWAKDLETHAMTLGNDFEPAMEKEIPDGASDDVKKSIEQHNEKVKEVAESFKNNVLAAYNRDPKSIAEMSFAKVKADHFENELKAVKTELEKTQTRLKEAEDKLAKVKSAGRLGHIESPGTGASKKAATTVEEGKIGGDGSTALHNFFANR